jgi:hypothetical protein
MCTLTSLISATTSATTSPSAEAISSLKTGLGGGAIAGIGIGSVAFLSLVIVFGIWYWRSKLQHNKKGIILIKQYWIHLSFDLTNNTRPGKATHVHPWKDDHTSGTSDHTVFPALSFASPVSEGYSPETPIKRHGGGSFNRVPTLYSIRTRNTGDHDGPEEPEAPSPSVT